MLVQSVHMVMFVLCVRAGQYTCLCMVVLCFSRCDGAQSTGAGLPIWSSPFSVPGSDSQWTRRQVPLLTRSREGPQSLSGEVRASGSQ
jgi:hypothetical protein